MSGHFSGPLNMAARGWLQTFLGSFERSQCWLSVRLSCGGQHSRHEATLDSHASYGDGHCWLL